MNYQEIGFIAIKPIVNKLPAGIWACLIICQLMRFGLFMIYGVSIICCQEIGKHNIFVTLNLAVFSSVTRSCGEDILIEYIG